MAETKTEQTPRRTAPPPLKPLTAPVVLDGSTVAKVPPPTQDGMPEATTAQPPTTADPAKIESAETVAETPAEDAVGEAPEKSGKGRQRRPRKVAAGAEEAAAPAAPAPAPAPQAVVASPAAALGYVAPDAAFAPPPVKLVPAHLHAAARTAALGYVKVRLRSLDRWSAYELAVAGIRALALPPEQGGMGLDAEAVEYALATLAAETGAPVPPPPAPPAAGPDGTAEGTPD